MNWNDIASIQLPSPQTEALLKKKNQLEITCGGKALTHLCSVTE